MKGQTYSFLSHDREGNPIQVVTSDLCVIYIPLAGLGIDGKKLAVAESERAELEKSVANAEKFLCNQAFIEKAPTEVVEGKRAFVAKAKGTLAMMDRYKDGIDMDEIRKQSKMFLEQCKTDSQKASVMEWLERENCVIVGA